MDPEGVFRIANLAALLGWVALAALPFRRAVHWHLCGVALPAAFAVTYVTLLAVALPGGEGGFSTLAGVRALFRSDWALLAGWLHYLAFDLAIGAWMARRATAEGWSRWRLLPCLPPTFLFGPAGLLLFLLLRAVRSQRAA